MTGSAAPKPISTGPAPGRFAIAGTIATVIDFTIAVVLAENGVPRLPADAIALTLAAAAALTLHGRLTLRGDVLDRWIRRPSVFVTVAVVAGLVDLTIFVSLGGLSPWVAKVVALATAALVRAVAHRFVLFRAVRREQDQPAGRPLPSGDFRLSVVVPAYREERRIAATVGSIRSALADLDAAGQLEIVVVDDGSRDATAQAARQGGADLVIAQPRNRGKGAAIRAGAAAARGTVIAFTDADLAYPPGQLSVLLEAIESGWDVVIGNRHDHGSDTLVGTSALRSFGSRVVNMASTILLLGNYRDTQCGCKAFRSDVAAIVLGAGRIDGFAVDIEILHLVERHGFSLKEVPVEVINSDTSTVRAVRDGLSVVRDILRIRRLAARGGYPDPAP